ncbi:MAG: cytochrome c biogenesis protein CcsA [Planctomycetota bacterium]|jgi:cytochrome c-type biogenesis protein CcsB
MGIELVLFWCTFGILAAAFVFTAGMFSLAFIGARDDGTGKFALRKFSARTERIALAVISLAAVGVCATLIARGIEINKLPFHSIYETLLICAFGTLIAFIILNAIYRVGYLGGVATLFALVMMMLGFMQRRAEASVLPPALQSWWFIPHVASYIVGYGFCGFAFFIALMDLMGRKKHRLFAAAVLAFCSGFALNKLLLFLARPKYIELAEHLGTTSPGYWTKPASGFDYGLIAFTTPVLIYGIISLIVFLGVFAGLALLLTRTKFSDTLSSLPMLGRVFHWLTMIGFFLLTFGLLSGAAWGKTALSDYWQWDPKENLGLITWFIYLIYLHLMRQGMKSRTAAAWVNVLGLAVIMFTWFNANVFGGWHAYASALAESNDFAYVHAIVFAVMLLGLYVLARVRSATPELSGESAKGE